MDQPIYYPGSGSARLSELNSYFTLHFTQITGGSSGIGKCLAIDAIKRGAASVTIVARNKVSHGCREFIIIHFIRSSLVLPGET